MILLRDDSVAVRIQISDFVFELTRVSNNDEIRRGIVPIDIFLFLCSVSSKTLKIVAAIPIVAEDTYLRWLDQTFVAIDAQSAWTLWRQLLRKFELSKEIDTNGDCGRAANEESASNLEDIFDANEANIFGETLFACFKCYEYLLGRIDSATNLNDEEKCSLKEAVSKEFSMLVDF